MLSNILKLLYIQLNQIKYKKHNIIGVPNINDFIIKLNNIQILFNITFIIYHISTIK
jgi:hypothetical protein